MSGSKNNGFSKLLDEFTNYKGFVIKFIAIAFHDNIIPVGDNGDHIHLIEHVVFWFLIILLVPTTIATLMLSWCGRDLLINRLQFLAAYDTPTQDHVCSSRGLKHT